MASIRTNLKNGALVSFTFTASFGKNAKGKQIRRYKNWTSPKGMSQTKAAKLFEKTLFQCERHIRREPLGKVFLATIANPFLGIRH